MAESSPCGIIIMIIISVTRGIHRNVCVSLCAYIIPDDLLIYDEATQTFRIRRTVGFSPNEESSRRTATISCRLDNANPASGPVFNHSVTIVAFNSKGRPTMKANEHQRGCHIIVTEAKVRPLFSLSLVLL